MHLLMMDDQYSMTSKLVNYYLHRILLLLQATEHHMTKVTTQNYEQMTSDDVDIQLHCSQRSTIVNHRIKLIRTAINHNPLIASLHVYLKICSSHLICSFISSSLC